MASVTVPASSTLPVAGADIIAAPLNGWITNIKDFVEGANIDENNVDYSSIDGIVVKQQTQTITGAKTFSASITASAGMTSGGNIISDTDSTDNLGSASVRWANLYVDSIGDTGQDLTIAATTTNLPSGHIFDYNSADVTITHAANTLTIAGGTTVVDALTSGGNVISDTDSTDDLGTTSVRWANLYVDSIGDTGQALTITAGTNAITLTAGDVTLYDDNNNADTSISIGTSATERIGISVLNGAANKTAEEVRFTSYTASATADHGKFTFYVDESGSAIFSVDDGGVDVTGAQTISSTLDVTGLTTATGGVTSGGNIVSDTDSTDDLGTTSVRWANLYVDSIGDTGQALTVTAGANNVNMTAGTFALTGAQTISSTLGVTGLTTATGGITSGGNIISDTDSTDDLGTTSVRWANVYADSLGDTGQDLGIAATTVNLPSGFVFDYNAADVTITHSANTLTIAGGTLVGTINPDASSVLANGVTATTQSASDNSTKVATTAYADAAAAASAGTPGGSNTHVQFNNSGAFGGSANLTFDGTNLTATLSATSVLASGVTATTQSASDNSTKVATTAYVETAVAAGGAGAAFSEFLLIGA